MDDRLALHLELAALTDEEFVERAYALTLRRPPDGPGRGRALASLGDGTLSRATLLGELVESGFLLHTGEGWIDLGERGAGALEPLCERRQLGLAPDEGGAFETPRCVAIIRRRRGG